MGYVGNQTTNAYTSITKQDITGNGGTAYTLDHAVANANEIEVFVNNVRQEPSVAYTVSGTALTMTGNVQSSDDFYVVFQGKAVGTVVPPDDSVTTARINDGAVTTAKLADDAVTTAKLPAGSILQVKQTVITSRTQINTTGEQTFTGASVSITPTSTSSKILIISAIGCIAEAPNSIRLNLYRGSTQVNNMGHYATGNTWKPFNCNFNYLDSPSTTSQVTYQLKGEVSLAGGGGIYFNYANTGLWTNDTDARGTITAMEIAG